MEPGDAEILLHFSIGDRRYALPIGSVSEVATLTPKASVPGAPASVTGLGELRGRVLTLLDLERLLALPPSARPERAPSVVLAPPYEHIALPVDRILGIPALATIADGAPPRAKERQVPPASGGDTAPSGQAAGPEGGAGLEPAHPLAGWILDPGLTAAETEEWNPGDSEILDPRNLIVRCSAEVRNRYRIPDARNG